MSTQKFTLEGRRVKAGFEQACSGNETVICSPCDSAPKTPPSLLTTGHGCKTPRKMCVINKRVDFQKFCTKINLAFHSPPPFFLYSHELCEVPLFPPRKSTCSMNVFPGTGPVVHLMDFHSKCLWYILAKSPACPIPCVHFWLKRRYLPLRVTSPPDTYSSAFQFTLVRETSAFDEETFFIVR